MPPKPASTPTDSQHLLFRAMLMNLKSPPDVDWPAVVAEIGCASVASAKERFRKYRVAAEATYENPPPHSKNQAKPAAMKNTKTAKTKKVSEKAVAEKTTNGKRKRVEDDEGEAEGEGEGEIEGETMITISAVDGEEEKSWEKDFEDAKAKYEAEHEGRVMLEGF